MSDDSFAGFIPHVPPQFDAMVLSAFLSLSLTGNVPQSIRGIARALLSRMVLGCFNYNPQAKMLFNLTLASPGPASWNITRSCAVTVALCTLRV